MVMNKKGFLKILEAIVAILIVLGFIVAIIPEKPPEQAKLPPDLEQTTNTILKELQENPEFRACVLELGETDYDRIRGEGAQCVYRFVEFITEPRVLHPWDYAARVCTATSGEISECTFYEQNMRELFRGTSDVTNTAIVELAGRVEKNIYIRSVTITVEDVLGSGSAGSVSDGPQPDEQRIITIFAWSKR